MRKEVLPIILQISTCKEAENLCYTTRWKDTNNLRLRPEVRIPVVWTHTGPVVPV